MTPTEDGFRGLDVWESPDAFDRFIGERLAPVLQRLEIPPPDVTISEVHNVLIGTATPDGEVSDG